MIPITKRKKWKVASIYEFQHFCCPACDFKIQDKQNFLDHAFKEHPECTQELCENIKDDSLIDVLCPWNSNLSQVKTELKEDNEDFYIPPPDDDQMFDDDHQDYEEHEDPEDPEDPDDQDSDYEPPVKVKDEEDSKSEYKCETCEKTFALESALKTHRTLTHDKEPPKEYNCLECNIDKFKTPDEMNNHMIEVHAQENKTECPKCNKKFIDGHLLDWHALKIHKIKQCTCAECFKTLNTPSSRRRHIEIFHNKGVKDERITRKYNSKCSLCEFNGPKIREHWNEHHFGEPLPEKCTQCDFETFTKQHLDLHQKFNHEHGQSFECDKCEFKTINSKEFKRHQRTHDDDFVPTQRTVKRSRDDRKMRCTLCGVRCVTIAQHWASEHPDEPLPLLCHLCDYRTCADSYLKKHIEKMHGDQKFTCSVCGYETKFKGTLKRHEKMHTGVKDFTCDICAKALTTERSLRCHLYKVMKNCISKRFLFDVDTR